MGEFIPKLGKIKRKKCKCRKKWKFAQRERVIIHNIKRIIVVLQPWSHHSKYSVTINQLLLQLLFYWSGNKRKKRSYFLLDEGSWRGWKRRKCNKRPRVDYRGAHVPQCVLQLVILPITLKLAVWVLILHTLHHFAHYLLCCFMLYDSL